MSVLGPMHVVCGFQAHRNVEMNVVCVLGTPICVYIGRRNTEPQTTLIVCWFFRVPKVETADNVRTDEM